MLFNKKSQLINYLLTLIFLALININPVLAKTTHQPPLKIENITFSPDFVTVRQKNDILISVKLNSSNSAFPNKKLILEQKKTRPNGRNFYRPIAKLRDNGKKGDMIAGDSIYTANVPFFQAINDDITLRVVARQKRHRDKLISNAFTLAVKNFCGPTASILPVRIVTIEPDTPKSTNIQFEVPGSSATPREIVLRVINGAQINAPISNRISRAVVSLNDNKLLRIRKSHNISEIPISLKQGPNTLTIDHLRGRSGQSIAIEINACADQIDLTPFTDTLIVGTDSITATAKITALGLPVENATVNFNLSNLSEQSSQSASSAADGIAQISFPLTDEGTGELQATVEESMPELKASTSIQAIKGASISLNQGFKNLTLAPEDNESLPFILFYLSSNSSHITFDYKIEPDNGGILVSGGKSPAEDLLLSRPQSVEFKPSVTAISAGEYTLTAQATVLETGETTSTTTLIHVVEKDTPEPLIINQPGFTPSGIDQNTATTVVIRAFIQGTTTPPNRLLLDEVDLDGNILNSAVAELNDAGNNGDDIANDFIYTSQKEFNQSKFETLYFRIRAEYFGQEVLSQSASLTVTPFSLQVSPPDTDQLIDGATPDSQIYANELLVKLAIGTTPARAESIAKSIDGTIVSIIPALQLYQIQFNGDGTFQGVQQAIATVSEFLDVISATANNEVTLTGSNCSFGDANSCPNDPEYINQAHLTTIRAKQAWDSANLLDSTNFAGSSAFPVAIIDQGVDTAHSDLVNQFLANSSTGAGTSNEHGTIIANIIAANINTINGAGIAWNSKIQSFDGGTSEITIISALTAAASSTNKVFNISMKTTESSNLKAAICSAADQGKLMVISAGNPQVGQGAIESYPAQYNENTTYLCPNGANLSSHILAVGGSDENDNIAKWSITDSGFTFNFQSNPVNWIDIYAPGVNIKTYLSTSANGTSFAAPQVAGAATMLWPLMQSGTNAETIHNRLIETAIEIGDIASLGNNKQEKRLDLLNMLPPNSGAEEIKNVTINLVAENADFNNLFGIYNSQTKQATILFDNINLTLNSSPDNFEIAMEMSDEDLANLQFFIIPNGASINNTYLQITSPTDRDLFVVESAGFFRLADQSSNTVLAGTNAPAFFSEEALNPGNQIQVIRNSDETSEDTNFHLNWEDLPLLSSDRDYNDAIFSITIQ